MLTYSETAHVQGDLYGHWKAFLAIKLGHFCLPAGQLQYQTVQWGTETENSLCSRPEKGKMAFFAWIINDGEVGKASIISGTAYSKTFDESGPTTPSAWII